MIWQPYIKKNGEWIAAKLLQGFFGAPMESLAEISVSDVVSSPGVRGVRWESVKTTNSSSPTSEASTWPSTQWPWPIAIISRP